MRHRIAAVAILLVVGATFPAPARAAGLWDINGHWAQAAIQDGLADGYINGFPDGSFRPNQSITRAEFFKLLTAALQLRNQPEQTAPYAPWHWSVKQGQVQAAVAAGLLKPLDYGNWILLDSAIPRREILMAAVRAVGKEGLVGSSRLTSADAGTYPKWLQDWAAIAVEGGLLGGYQDGSLGLERTATRAEALVIIQRILSQVTMHLAPADGAAAPNQYRYPAPGEPVWSLSQPSLGRPVFQVEGQRYQLDVAVSGFTLRPAPGRMAWLVTQTSVTNQAGSKEQYDLWRLQDGRAERVATYTAPVIPLAVDGTGRLWLSQADQLMLSSPTGETLSLPIGEQLRFADLREQGGIWAVGSAGLYQVSPTAKGSPAPFTVSRVGLTDTGLSDPNRIRSLLTGPDNSVWLFLAGLSQGDPVQAVRFKGGALSQPLPVLTRKPGMEQPIQAALLGRSANLAWVIAAEQSAPGGRSLYRFDLTNGASARMLPPRWVGLFSEVFPAPDAGAMLQDQSGKFWRVLP